MTNIFIHLYKKLKEILIDNFLIGKVRNYGFFPKQNKSV